MHTTAFKHPLRPARFDEIGFVQEHIGKAVDELLGPSSDFALAEKARFHARFITALMQADPGYVVIVETPIGKRAGFIVGIPDMGNIVFSWGYLLPEFRKGALAMRSVGEFVRLWDNRNFHKMIYYILPENRHSELIGRHAKFQKVGLLRQHFYGVDFVLYEKFYNKTVPGFAPAPQVLGLRGKLQARWRNLVRRKHT
jgi:L-amino acid N-acyltransferase YncA